MLGAAIATVMSVSACGAARAGSGSSGAAAPADSQLINVCGLVPSSQVAAVTGHQVTHAAPSRADSSPDPDAFACTYFLSTGNAVGILVAVTNSKDVFVANERALYAGGAFPVTKLHGIGDQAGESALGLAALAGAYNIVISADRPGQFAGSPSGVISLAKNLISALGSGPEQDGGS
jgi:hypothetical protein